MGVQRHLCSHQIEMQAVACMTLVATQMLYFHADRAPLRRAAERRGDGAGVGGLAHLLLATLYAKVDAARTTATRPNAGSRGGSTPQLAQRHIDSARGLLRHRSADGLGAASAAVASAVAARGRGKLKELWAAAGMLRAACQLARLWAAAATDARGGSGSGTAATAASAAEKGAFAAGCGAAAGGVVDSSGGGRPNGSGEEVAGGIPSGLGRPAIQNVALNLLLAEVGRTTSKPNPCFSMGLTILQSASVGSASALSTALLW